MTRESRTSKRSWRNRAGLLIAVLAALMPALCATPARADDIPMVVESIEKAQAPATDEGKWQITATVTISSDTKPTMKAVGVVTAAGDGEEVALTGNLPMTIDGEAGASSLAFNLKRDGGVGLQWLIANKAYLGRAMAFYHAIPSPDGDYLSRKIKWNGDSRVLVIRLAAERVKVSSGTPPRIRVPKAPEKKVIGTRYQVTARVYVTNSEDGLGDDTVEVRGSLSVHYINAAKNRTYAATVGTFHKTSLRAGDSVSIGTCFVDSFLDKPNTQRIQLEGSFIDVDYPISGPEGMMSRFGRPTDLAKAVTYTKESVMHGDDDSESLDVYYKVTEVGPIYDTP